MKSKQKVAAGSIRIVSEICIHTNGTRQQLAALGGGFGFGPVERVDLLGNMRQGLRRKYRRVMLFDGLIDWEVCVSFVLLLT